MLEISPNLDVYLCSCSEKMCRTRQLWRKYREVFPFNNIDCCITDIRAHAMYAWFSFSICILYNQCMLCEHFFLYSFWNVYILSCYFMFLVNKTWNSLLFLFTVVIFISMLSKTNFMNLSIILHLGFSACSHWINSVACCLNGREFCWRNLFQGLF